MRPLRGGRDPNLARGGPADTCAPEADDAGETLPDLPANAKVASVSVVGTAADLDEIEPRWRDGIVTVFPSAHLVHRSL
jgi:hypothetical protein